MGTRRTNQSRALRCTLTAVMALLTTTACHKKEAQRETTSLVGGPSPCSTNPLLATTTFSPCMPFAALISLKGVRLVYNSTSAARSDANDWSLGFQPGLLVPAYNARLTMGDDDDSFTLDNGTNPTGPRRFQRLADDMFIEPSTQELIRLTSSAPSVVAKRIPDGPELTFAPNGAGELWIAGVQLASGARIDVERDALGRLDTLSWSDDTATFQYSGGRVSSITYDSGDSYAFDYYGSDLEAIRDTTGALDKTLWTFQWLLGRDGTQLLGTLTEAGEEPSVLSYDNKGWLTSLVRSDDTGRVTTSLGWTWTPSDVEVELLQHGRTYSSIYTYGNQGVLSVTSTAPNASRPATTTMTRTPRGNIQSLIDWRGAMTLIAYEEVLGEQYMTAVGSTYGPSVSYTYNQGRTESVTLRFQNGRIATATVSAWDEALKVPTEISFVTPEGTVTKSTEYTGDGNVLRQTSTIAQTRTTERAYTGSNLTSVTRGGTTTRYQDGRVSEVERLGVRTTFDVGTDWRIHGHTKSVGGKAPITTTLDIVRGQTLPRSMTVTGHGQEPVTFFNHF